MKNFGLIAFLCLAGCNNQNTDYDKKYYVEFEPIAVIKTDHVGKNEVSRSATVFRLKDQFDHILNDSSDVYFAFKDRIADSLLDFNKYDYVFSYGREIDSLSHSKAFTDKHDACSSKEKTALEKTYKSVTNDSLLFIYRLKEKNKYADPCG